MVWKLISYSEVKIPLPPNTPDYVVGIAENKVGQKSMVRISKEYARSLSMGLEGEITSADGPTGEINIFTPIVKKQKEISPVKVALITGSSRGIGRAIAFALAKKGIDIVINNGNEPLEGAKVAEEIRELGRHAIYVQADVANYEQVEKMVERTINEFGSLDILINNAGIVMDRLLENMSSEQWNNVISVNLTGTFNCTKVVAKHMQKQGCGRIINISSIVGEIGNIGQSNYSASKGGIISFTKTIAKEYARDGITVNAIAPGYIKTRMTDGIPKGVMRKILEQIPVGRIGKPEEIASLVCFLISDDASYITGQTININGGLYV